MTTILPPASTFTERAIEAATARPDALAVLASGLWSPDTCPVAFLPWLAWAVSVDEWDPNWSVARQREAVAASIDIHRLKGTVWAIRRVLEVMGYGDCDITENWQTLVGADWAVGDATQVGWQSTVGAPWVVDAGLPVGGNHWAEYWVTVRAPITPAMAASMARRLAAVAPTRCRLARINVDAVTVVVGGPWAVGDITATVGATYPLMEVIQ